MAFIPYVSNRLEPLADKLCEILKLSSLEDDIFHKDYIIVQAKGMEQWIKYRIAETNGIASLIEFPFPEAFLENFFPKLNDDIFESVNSTSNVKFNREVLTWSIMKELPALVAADIESGNDLFVTLRKYLNSEDKNYSDTCDIKLLQLSEKIADLFYKYLAYRPDCLLYWEGKSESAFNIPEQFKQDSWQKELWIKVSETLGFDYLPRRVYESAKSGILQDYAQKNPIKRAFVFGITTMPPFYLEIFIELSRYIDIHFFYRNICCDNWEHNFSEKELFKYFSRSNCEIEMPDIGNELLASLAFREREFFSLLVSGGFVDSEGDYINYLNSKKNVTLLSSIQNDILNMCEPEIAQLVEKGDTSIQFHSFHNPMREIESLHDYLLKFMDESDGEIKPKDIIVMTPDIQKYAPFVEAVFESKKLENSYIYSTISDRNIKDTNIEAEVYLSLLNLVNSRFKVTDVLSLLSIKAISQSFGFGDEDMDLIHKWLHECSVNWGIDEQNRKDILHSESSFYENSWKAGLDRMIFGYSMTAAERDVKQSLYCTGHSSGILPYEEIEGSNSIVLGKLLDFTEELFALNERFSREMTPEEWRNKLSEVIDIFFSRGIDAVESIDILYRSVNSMFNDINSAGFNSNIGIDIVCSYLGKNLKEKFTPLQFLRGGVSFCRFTPMRSIPAKVICMIGMNEDAFPGKEGKTGFDLMQNQRRSCDPSLKSEDRYMFLETLISASDKLYVSYIGRSVIDNSKKLPSVVLSELKEYIDRNYNLDSDKESSVSSSLSIEHPLHGFSSQYFTGKLDSANHLTLFSYSKENCNISSLLNKSAMDKKLYLLNFSKQIPEIIDKTVTIDELVSFYQNPSKYLLRNRVNISLDTYLKEELNDKEIIDINNLEKYFINQDLLSISDGDFDLTGKETFDFLKSKGLIPPGKWGETCAEEIIQNVIKFKDGLEEYIEGGKLTSCTEYIDLSMAEYVDRELSLEFSNLYRKGQIFFRLGSARAVDLINAWIFHVGLSLSNCQGERITYLITWNKSKAIHNIILFDTLERDDAKLIMNNILLYYYSGVQKPLPFFPECSMAYAAKLKKNGTPEDAYSAALVKWKSNNNFSMGEGEDNYFKLCYGEELPGLDDINEPALSFYKPLLKMKKEVAR